MNRTGGADPGEHLGDLAELYALGTLGPEDRLRVEAHAASCGACARALGAAEATIAALDDAFVARVAPPERLAARIAAAASSHGVKLPSAPSTSFAPHANVRATWLPNALAAAAIALALGIGADALTERSADMRQATRDSAVLATIANAHFSHVSLSARDPRAPVSKALYARDGTWSYIIVDSATCACHVVARSANDVRDLGAPDVRGSTATLFVRDFPRPTSLTLVDQAGRVIAEATLVYPKSP